MELVIYYEGADSIEDWLNSILPNVDISFEKLPNKNNSKSFDLLPENIKRLLYLDKPDIIISGKITNDYYKPFVTIELASCTPQYQHALQRFPRMLGSISINCPSFLIMPSEKRGNSNAQPYKRSQAIDYGAFRLMELYSVPAFVLDWPSDENGYLIFNKQDNLPPIDCNALDLLKEFLNESLENYKNENFVSKIMGSEIVEELKKYSEPRALKNGRPNFDKPSGERSAKSKVKLDLLDTEKLISEIFTKQIISKKERELIPSKILNRNKSIVMYPTRILEHAGDPYVGMLCYYDIALCRNGPDPINRDYNLIAYCRNLSKNQIKKYWDRFNINSIENIKQSKPLRIYYEIADLIIFSDGILYKN